MTSTSVPRSKNSRVEPLDEADLENQSVLICQGDQFVRLGKRRGDRFFQEDIRACFQKDGSDLKMGAGRYGDRDGVDHSRKLPVILHNRATGELRSLPGAFLDRIGNADDPAARNLLIFL